MNRKIIRLAIVFLLLIPFRLPIGVAFVNLTISIAELAGELNDKVLVANVVLTKIIYDLALSAISGWNVYLIEKRFVKDKSFLGLPTAISCILLVCYAIFDGVTTYDLYFLLK
jgi:hypothetical protein